MVSHSGFQTVLSNTAAVELPDAILVRDAGLPYQTPAHVDPITQWLGLMEVVQMLCPDWPVRHSAMVGEHWRL